MRTNDKGILRVLDANFNRTKEGLRVIEDIFRFVLEDDRLRKKIRNLRHAFDTIVTKRLLNSIIESRDSGHDLGRKNDLLEQKRGDITELLYVNFQRVKESLRVLEEFFKLSFPRQVAGIKKMRYALYTLEKETFKLRPVIRNI